MLLKRNQLKKNKENDRLTASILKSSTINQQSRKKINQPISTQSSSIFIKGSLGIQTKETKKLGDNLKSESRDQLTPSPLKNQKSKASITQIQTLK